MSTIMTCSYTPDGFPHIPSISEHLHTRIDKVNTRVNGLSEEIEQLDAKVDTAIEAGTTNRVNMGVRVLALEKKTDGHSGRLDALSLITQDHRQEIDSLTRHTSSHGSNISGLLNRVDKLEKQAFPWAGATDSPAVSPSDFKELVQRVERDARKIEALVGSTSQDFGRIIKLEQKVQKLENESVPFIPSIPLSKLEDKVNLAIKEANVGFADAAQDFAKLRDRATTVENLISAHAQRLDTHRVDLDSHTRAKYNQAQVLDKQAEAIAQHTKDIAALEADSGARYDKVDKLNCSVEDLDQRTDGHTKRLNDQLGLIAKQSKDIKDLTDSVTFLSKRIQELEGKKSIFNPETRYVISENKICPLGNQYKHEVINTETGKLVAKCSCVNDADHIATLLNEWWNK